MKAVFSLLGGVVVLGALYGLAFLGIIPVQKLAASNPAVGQVLIAMHLAHKPKPTVIQSAHPPSDPKVKSLEVQQVQIASERAQLEKDKAAFATQTRRATETPTAEAASNPAFPVQDTATKLTAIYATMSPDDIAKIFAKLPDPLVIQNLMSLEEEKAGKVMAAMPADRTARLSQLMLAKSTARRIINSPQPRSNIP